MTPRSRTASPSSLAPPASMSFPAPPRAPAAPRPFVARALALALLAAVLLLAAEPAAAQVGGGGDLTGFLQNVVNLFTGTAGRLIAVLAICLVGIGALMGALSLRAAGGVVLGVMLLFSSAWIVNQIVGA